MTTKSSAAKMPRILAAAVGILLLLVLIALTLSNRFISIKRFNIYHINYCIKGYKVKSNDRTDRSLWSTLTKSVFGKTR